MLSKHFLILSSMLSQYLQLTHCQDWQLCLHKQGAEIAVVICSFLGSQILWSSPKTPHCFIADMHSVSAGTKSLSYHVCSWASPAENGLPPGFAPQCPFSPSQSPAGWWLQIVSAASRSPHCWSQCLRQGGKIDLHDEAGYFPFMGTPQ